MKGLTSLKKTCLYEKHISKRGKMVNYNGWLLPMWYEKGTFYEHRSTREKVGIFDVSHMGRVIISGTKAAAFLQYMTTNDVKKLQVGQSQYSMLCSYEGGVIDDLIIYRLQENMYLLCLNATNLYNDLVWFKERSVGFGDLEIEDKSQQWAQIAVQGPKSEKLLSLLTFDQEAVSQKFGGISEQNFLGQRLWVARTGYTGEKGFELYLPVESAVFLWDQIFSLGSDVQVEAIGLAARDTLRVEACFLLYGNDITLQMTPFESNAPWVVKLQKGDFVGRKALIEQQKQGISRKIFAFKMLEPSVPRQGMGVFIKNRKVGEVTSGSRLPTVGGFGGMALIEQELFDTDLFVQIDVRGVLKKAELLTTVLYKSKAKEEML